MCLYSASGLNLLVENWDIFHLSVCLQHTANHLFIDLLIHSFIQPILIKCSFCTRHRVWHGKVKLGGKLRVSCTESFSIWGLLFQRLFIRHQRFYKAQWIWVWVWESELRTEVILMQITCSCANYLLSLDFYFLIFMIEIIIIPALPSRTWNNWPNYYVSLCTALKR